MLEALIKFVKNRRKQAYLKSNYSQKYAFIGIGSHSINNLYPILNYLNINLKYIVTKSAANAALVDRHFPHTTGTNDLDSVLKDEEIAGVFICTQPAAHFKLVRRVLEANKHVFVEKPPCLHLADLKTLIALEQKSDGTCLVGLQKHYAPVNVQLRKYLKPKSTYNYRFLTGAYPEGDPLLDLFIHPLALINFLFGSIKTFNILANRSKTTLTLFLQIEYENETKGSVELSTAYAWNEALEQLNVNTPKGVYELTNTEKLIFKPHVGTIFKIPKDKIFNLKNTAVSLQMRNNFSSLLQNNQLYSAGYFTMLDHFLGLCESKSKSNSSTLASCQSVYETIESINQIINV